MLFRGIELHRGGLLHRSACARVASATGELGCSSPHQFRVWESRALASLAKARLSDVQFSEQTRFIDRQGFNDLGVKSGVRCVAGPTYAICFACTSSCRSPC
jgi:hypothetical protein